jgi:uncharacterized protein YdhG (YjbR/CyaY superfamily)
MTDPETVDDYVATLAPDRRAVMEQFRATITAAAPDAVESLAYKMPAFRSHGGQFLVSFDAYYSLFPASESVVERLGDEIRPFLAGQGTIRFPASKPIPTDLITRIVKIRLAENAARQRR